MIGQKQRQPSIALAKRRHPGAKLSLDALIQREVPERIRTSTFARSETLLQLSWVVGGFIGIVMPLNPQLGLGVAAGILVLWSGFVLHSRRVR